MSDLGEVFALWREAKRTGEDYVLATIVAVEGSSYRKPGARMILTRSGRRAGTISGGCLEGDVSAKAWWHTEKGPAVKEYSTTFDMDDDAPPYGMGCGGVVHILLERSHTADPLLEALSSAFSLRVPAGVTTVLDGSEIGTHILAGIDPVEDSLLEEGCRLLALRAVEKHLSPGALNVSDDHYVRRVFVEYVPPRVGLFLFGAGDDVHPLVVQARTLGWYIQVSDGRSHLATRGRFPEADAVTVGTAADLPQMRISDAAVLMTHSYEQDLSFLTKLLKLPLGYLGVLGPKHRTQFILERALEQVGGRLEEFWSKVYSPVGLDLGAASPASIALSIVAEIQAKLSRSTGMSLRDLRREPSLNTPIERLKSA